MPELYVFLIFQEDASRKAELTYWPSSNDYPNEST
jgi:hypothetical protein